MTSEKDTLIETLKRCYMAIKDQPAIDYTLVKEVALVLMSSNGTLPGGYEIQEIGRAYRPLHEGNYMQDKGWQGYVIFSDEFNAILYCWHHMQRLQEQGE